MDHEESVFMEELTRRINEHLHRRNVASKEQRDLVINDVMNDALIEIDYDSTLITNEARSELESEIAAFNMQELTPPSTTFILRDPLAL
jgi:hypothetical protein